MKKILYTLFAVSLLAVGCTKEVGVSRDHDINAEVTDMQTKMEMTTLYLNLTESNTEVNLDQLTLYLVEKSADVAMFVAPTTIGVNNFKTWLNTYATEQGGLTVLTSVNDDNRLLMAALVKESVSIEDVYTIQQGASLNNAVLHFKANGIHFVVTEFEPAKNAIPDDWQTQVEDMLENKKQIPFTYNPDNLANRKTELTYLIKQTADNKAYLKDVNWYFALNTNADSHLDIAKYEKEFYLENCYDAPADPDFYWEDFLATEHNYYSISELLDVNDIYFNISNLMMYYNLIDCNAVHHSVYTPSSTDGSRSNNVYATDECWNMFHTFDFDASLMAETGLAHYPIIVTLKSEE